MLDVEVLGSALPSDGPSAEEVRRLCVATAASRGVRDGHVAVELVGRERIAELNRVHRGRPGATDVLSFPIDGVARTAAGEREQGSDPVPRELGDVVICPERCGDVREAIVHGMLHLLGMDHEQDEGEMLELQDRLIAEHRP